MRPGFNIPSTGMTGCCRYCLYAQMEMQTKKPRAILLLRAYLGGNGGIRTLDEALHPILP